MLVVSPPTVAAGSRLNSPAENGDIAVNAHAFVETEISAKRRRVSSDLPLVLDHDAAAESGYVARYMSTHTNAAAKASSLADFFARPDADVVSGASDFVRAIGERDCSESHHKEQPRR